MSKYQDNLNNLMCLDIFLMGSGPHERQHLYTKILPNESEIHILLSYDVAAIAFEKLREKMTDEAILEKYAKKFAWQADMKKILCNDFQALVLTNAERQILWTNKGFEKMTGYLANEAIGKKPTFLEGKNTAENTRLLFRQKLALQVPFEMIVVNYRKNGEEYICRVKIFPLQNTRKDSSHYLALEQEIQ
jgi:PAS domain S-box-containing protein